jgi:hypothetical protein
MRTRDPARPPAGPPHPPALGVDDALAIEVSIDRIHEDEMRKHRDR